MSPMTGLPVASTSWPTLADQPTNRIAAEAPVALAALRDGRICWSNDALNSMLRCDPSWARGRAWAELGPDPTHRGQATGDSEEAGVLRASDGSSMPVICRHSQGLVAGEVVVAVWPLESLDAIAERLQESEQRFRDFAEAASDWLWETGGDHRLVYVSERLRGLIGDRVDGWLGRCLRDVADPGGMIEPDDAREALAECTSFRGVRMTISAVDRIYVMEIAGVPVCDATGVFRGYRGIGRDVTAAVEADERIRWLARHDGLTRLANRSLFNEQLDTTLRLARRSNQRFAVLLIDLDDFKRINDTYGHAGGDRLLIEVAKRIADSVRETDLPARLGGDEFAILQVGLHGFADASSLARRVITALTAPIDVGEREIVVRASCGIAIFPDDGDGPAAVLRAADVALYRAKAMGGNAMLFFVPHMDAEVTRRRMLEQDLRAAIDGGELALHYQPQVDMRTGRIVGVEALARWYRADGESVSPDLFVSIAEEFGHIHALGMWVLGEACRQARIWADAGFPDLKMAVNISPLELERDDIASEVLLKIADCGIRPDCIDLEITERTRLDEGERVWQRLQALTEAGIGLAIDDFGTGYSNLAYLHRLAITKLKIDRSFVRDLPGSRDSMAITRAIIQLAKALGLETVAEGVETEDQLTELRRMGCSIAQGHLFSRSLPPDKVLSLLRAPPDWRMGELDGDASDDPASGSADRASGSD